jgi:hypothetical protein
MIPLRVHIAERGADEYANGLSSACHNVCHCSNSSTAP